MLIIFLDMQIKVCPNQKILRWLHRLFFPVHTLSETALYLPLSLTCYYLTLHRPYRHLIKVIRQMPSKRNPRDLWPGQPKDNYTENGKDKNKYKYKYCDKDMSWRTWIHDNHCDLTIKSDTGQHLQFLRCLLKYWFQHWPKKKMLIHPGIRKLMTLEQDGVQTTRHQWKGSNQLILLRLFKWIH